MTLAVTKVNKGLLVRTRRLREDLHRHPELGYQEKRTASLVARVLRKAGVDEVRTGLAETGVLGLLRGARPGRTVALRADMDALPIDEQTGLPYASVNKGVMHACGHDGHTAILLAVAELLAGLRERITGNVRFIFQPAEEGGVGGRRMAEAGCLKHPDVAAIFGLHSWSTVRAGQIELSPTPNVAMNGFRMDIKGKGGHGAHPDVCVDPVVIGAQIITAAQTIVSRERRPDQPAVLSFCSFNAGTKDNIIPDSARVLGTIRAMDMQTLRAVRRALGRLARGVAESMRAQVTIVDSETYPPVRNDPGLLELVRAVGIELLGERNVLPSREQSMGSEDFAFYLPDQGGVPGVLFRLGVGGKAGLHTARFDFGSAALEPGILMLGNVALRALERGE
jgi:amidohydrolase